MFFDEQIQRCARVDKIVRPDVSMIKLVNQIRVTVIAHIAIRKCHMQVRKRAYIAPMIRPRIAGLKIQRKTSGFVSRWPWTARRLR
jgi:hypothetical protein